MQTIKNDWNYIPFFRDTISRMSELTDEEFGRVARAVATADDFNARPEGLNDKLYMMYKIIVGEAMRVYSYRTEKREAMEKRRQARRKADAKSTPQKGSRQASYSPDDIDPDEALRLALLRSFGEEN